MPSIKEQVAHHHKVVKGFNEVVKKELVVFHSLDSSGRVAIYQELWGPTKEKRLAFVKNAYIYYRLQYQKPEGSKLYITDIETDDLIAKFESNQPILLV